MTKRKLCNTGSCWWQGGRPLRKQQHAQDCEHASIVCVCKVPCQTRRKSAQGKLCAGGSCVEKQQPRDLCVTEPGQRREQSFVPVRESLQVLGDELRLTERSTEREYAT